MFNRIKQLRLARGLSLEQLAVRMGGLVTKQSISKYEIGRANPSNVVMVRLATALGVKAITLWSEPSYTIELLAYRKSSGLQKTEKEHVENHVRFALEQRVKLQELQGQLYRFNLKVHGCAIRNLEQTEEAAESLRKTWNLGYDPIASMVAVLEDHSIHAESIEANPKFDGISAIAKDEKSNIVSAMLVSRQGLSGERQRLNFAHELGRLFLRCASTVDEEKAAFRFGAAFLAPRDLVFNDTGAKRSVFSFSELLLLKQRYGLSLQAVLCRLRDLGIITEGHYKQWCIEIRRQGWSKREPEEIAEEKPQWLQRTVGKALAEGYMNASDASLFGFSVADNSSIFLTEKREFIKLPKSEQTKRLSEQADAALKHYSVDESWKEFQKGDFVEYGKRKP